MRPPPDDLPDMTNNGLYLLVVNELLDDCTYQVRTLVGYKLCEVVYTAPLTLIMRRKLEQPVIVFWHEIERMKLIVAEKKGLT